MMYSNHPNSGINRIVNGLLISNGCETDSSPTLFFGKFEERYYETCHTILMRIYGFSKRWNRFELTGLDSG